MSDYSICLNMIVKNEAHVIKDTLINLYNFIPFSYYVISDTGSSDNTKQIIFDFFNSININGEIHDDEWKDFGFNRSLALKYAFNKSKYILIFDADDRISGNFILPKTLSHDAYFFKFGSGVTYKRLLLVNNSLHWNFIGVLHEYINCLSNNNFSSHFIDGDYFIHSGKSGARSNDPNKYKNDAIVLENAFNTALINNDHIKIRYSFYCAQSYRDANDKINAIKWYKIRISLNDWFQEVYFSYFMLGKLYYDLNEHEKAIYFWSLASDVDPQRYECLFEIISHFRKINKFSLAFNYLSLIKHPINTNLNDKLFVFFPIYNFLLNFEIVLIAHHLLHFDLGLKTLHKLFITDNLPIDFMLQILDSLPPYLNHLSLNLLFFEDLFNFIQKIYFITKHFSINHIYIINSFIDKFKLLSSNFDLSSIKNSIFNNNINYNNNNNNYTVLLSITSCKRYDLFYKTVNSFLLNCKDIHKINYFFCVDDNSSKEDRKNMLLNFPFFKFLFKNNSQKGHLNSMNIIWDKLNLLKPTFWIHLEDDWLFFKPSFYVQNSIDFLISHKHLNIHQILFNKNYGEIFEHYNLLGGKPILNNQFLLHIKDEPNLNGRNSAYWPHFSFRPSMSFVETILLIGNFNSPNTFFELDFANKYFNNNFKSAFFNEISSIHIGKLTSDKKSHNAYSLNNVNQFSNNYPSNLFKYFFIDSKPIIIPPFFIHKLFKNNLFASNKIIIDTLFKHISLWHDLLKIDFNYFIIFNDPIHPSFDFNSFFKHHIDSHFDIILFNYNDVLSDFNNLTFKLSNDLNFNSMSYIISKNVILKLLKHIYTSGFKHPSLSLLFYDIPDLNILLSYDVLFKINDYNSFDCYSVLSPDFTFIPNKDHFGDDISFLPNKSIFDIMTHSYSFNNTIAFNSLGFIKNSLNYDNLINYNFNDDFNGGLFIKILTPIPKKYTPAHFIQFFNDFVIIKGFDLLFNHSIIQHFLPINDLINIFFNNTSFIAFNSNGHFFNLTSPFNIIQNNSSTLFIKLSHIIDIVIPNINSLDPDFIDNNNNLFLAKLSNGLFKHSFDFYNIIHTNPIYNHSLSFNLPNLLSSRFNLYSNYIRIKLISNHFPINTLFNMISGNILFNNIIFCNNDDDDLINFYFIFNDIPLNYIYIPNKTILFTNIFSPTKTNQSTCTLTNPSTSIPTSSTLTSYTTTSSTKSSIPTSFTTTSYIESSIPTSSTKTSSTKTSSTESYILDNTSFLHIYNLPIFIWDDSFTYHNIQNNHYNKKFNKFASLPSSIYLPISKFIDLTTNIHDYKYVIVDTPSLLFNSILSESLCFYSGNINDLPTSFNDFKNCFFILDDSIHFEHVLQNNLWQLKFNDIILFKKHLLLHFYFPNSFLPIFI